MLTLVIPLWQDAATIPHTADGVAKLRAALPYSIEVVAVDDGSTDASADAAEQAGFHVLRQPHRGRGAAIRAGMLAANGIYRMLVDACWSVPPEQVQLLLPPALTGFDIAVASRNLAGSTRHGESAIRRSASRGLARLVQAIVLPGISDVHSGFMCLRAEAARSLFARTREDGGAVEVEVLALARAFGLEVREIPVDWQTSAGVGIGGRRLRETPDLLTGLARVRARLATSAYPPLKAGLRIEPDGTHLLV
ncbi:MAG: glycosyltransferase [Oligoflexia bacterium]|nr:glycosyltransferase [Oligoflexia bacterium]